MRIVWKDSKPKNFKPIRYRNHIISGSSKGWSTNLPNDRNLYKTHYCALNAIDKALGGTGNKGKAKRKRTDIEIIGQKDDVS